MRLLANVYHNPPWTRAVPAAPPGYLLAFRGGHARIYDERTLMWCLTKPEITVALEPSYLGHVGRWVADMEKRLLTPRALLADPSGSIIPPDEYTVPGWMAPEVVSQFHEAQLREEDEALGRPPVEAEAPTGALVWGSPSSTS